MVAVLIPLMPELMAFTGAFTLTILGVVFPCILDICVRHPLHGKWNVTLWCNLVLILLGCVAASVGTFASVVYIIRAIPEYY